MPVRKKLWSIGGCGVTVPAVTAGRSFDPLDHAMEARHAQ
jgi:hypothetical protein